MPNKGAVSPAALSAGGSYTIPAGYHNGNGIVTMNSLENQTSATLSIINHPYSGIMGIPWKSLTEKPLGLTGLKLQV